MKKAIGSFILFLLAGACSGNSPDGTAQGAHSRPGNNDVDKSHAVIAARANRFDLVSNQPGAFNLDSKLVNAWGLAFNPKGAAWVSSNGANVVEVYGPLGATLRGSISTPEKPTAQVFNPESSSFKGDSFITVTEGGMIAGWQSGDAFVNRVDASSRNAIYKGVAIVPSSCVSGASTSSMLLAADFHNGMIDVYDSNYVKMDNRTFVNTAIPQGYAPFNVKLVENMIVITYAKQDENREDDVKGAGLGFVDIYDLGGHLMTHIADQSLNAPWGVTMTPATWVNSPHSLLIGNFGDGKINAWSLDFSDPAGRTVRMLGAIGDQDGNTMVIDGLWAIDFARNVEGFPSDWLYFTAGPNDEKDGLFGKLIPQQ